MELNTLNSGNKRISVNTSLKNARIFDDDSWDAEIAGFHVKKEPTPPQEEPEQDTDILEEKHYFGNVRIKNEEERFHSLSAGKKEHNEVGSKSKIKQEEFESEEKSSFLLEKDIKIESQTDEKFNFGNISLDHIDMGIKRELLDDDAKTSDVEESYLDRLIEHGRMDIINTPNKVDLKKEFSTDDSNPSPFNKELFKHFNLKQDHSGSPEPRQSSARETRKSVKRTVFTRNSPYKRHSPEDETPATKQGTRGVPIKDRLGIHDSEGVPKKKPRQERETDPLVLERRQKQIDYGKNTMGYDNYIRIVPKVERTREHVKTPDKFIKYSRRGWDGLIKQWRLKLHEYDPDDA